MKILGLILLTVISTVLSVDWYVCYYKKECRPLDNSPGHSFSQAEASIPVEPEPVEAPVPATPPPLEVVDTTSKEAQTYKEDSVQIIDDRIHFGSGAKNPLASTKVKNYLKSVVEKWKKNPKQTIRIMGHTDNRGRRKANYLLGLKRGTAIRKIIQGHGVPRKRIKVNSKGEMSPIGNNKTRQGRFLNRRVEVKVN